jgi:hypothetical protein
MKFTSVRSTTLVLSSSAQALRVAVPKINWGWLARNTTVAIGLTFVVLAVVYLAARLLVIDL